VKTCVGCGENKPLSEFPKAKQNKDGYGGKCKSCVRERWSEWYNDDAKKKNAARNRKYYASELGQRRAFEKRLARYGLSHDEYMALWDRSKGLCEICREAPAGAIDHDHTTGEVRGLLCLPHNRALGVFGDSADMLREAIRYLESTGL
jgi:hypothetical protein